MSFDVLKVVSTGRYPNLFQCYVSRLPYLVDLNDLRGLKD